MSKPTPAVAYYRMSSDKQETSIERQQLQVQRHARENGFEIVQEYTDEGLSGTTDKRPAFQRMIADAQAGRFTHLLIAHTNQLARQDLVDYFASVEASRTPAS